MRSAETAFRMERTLLMEAVGNPIPMRLSFARAKNEFLDAFEPAIRTYWEAQEISAELQAVLVGIGNRIDTTSGNGVYVYSWGHPENHAIVIAQTPEILPEDEFPSFLDAQHRFPLPYMVYAYENSARPNEFSVNIPDERTQKPSRWKYEPWLQSRVQTLPHDQKTIAGAILIHAIHTLIAPNARLSSVPPVTERVEPMIPEIQTVQLTKTQARDVVAQEGDLASFTPFDARKPFRQGQQYIIERITQGEIVPAAEIKYVKIDGDWAFLRSAVPFSPEERVPRDSIRIYGKIVMIFRKNTF